MITMNTTNAANLFELTAIQLMKLVSSSDLDASEFGTRFVKYLALLAKNNRTQQEQKDMETLIVMVVNDFSNAEFRKHLSEVVTGL